MEAASLVFSGASFGEHPTSSAAVEPVRTARPQARRLSTGGAELFCGAGAHVPHPDELQPPHVLPELPIILSAFSMTSSCNAILATR